MHQHLLEGSSFYGLLIAQTASAEHMELVPLLAASSDISTFLLPARVEPTQAPINRALPACLVCLQGANADNSNEGPKPTKSH